MWIVSQKNKYELLIVMRGSMGDNSTGRQQMKCSSPEGTVGQISYNLYFYCEHVLLYVICDLINEYMFNIVTKMAEEWSQFLRINTNG